MNRRRTRSGYIADYIRGFWSTPEPNLVRLKMLHPQRGMKQWQTVALKREIRLRLMDYYGYTIDHLGQMIKIQSRPKPRIRYKLRLRRTYVVHTLPSGQKYAEMIYVLASLLVCLFLSSAVEAANAGASGTWTDFRVANGNWFQHQSSAWQRPVVFATPSPWESKSSPIRFLPRLKTIDETVGCRMYTRHLEKQAEYNALVDGPRVVARDWRKFWLWLSAIGTGALALGSTLLYGAWRSVK